MTFQETTTFILRRPLAMPQSLNTAVRSVCTRQQINYTVLYIKKTNLMQSSSMFIGNCKIALHVSVAFGVHLQEH